MAPRHMFGALIRLLGFYFFYRSSVDGFFVIAHLVPIPISPRLSFAEDLTWTLFHAALGVIVVVGAEVIVTIVYGRASIDVDKAAARIFD
jgi:hypothetical protein